MVNHAANLTSVALWNALHDVKATDFNRQKIMNVVIRNARAHGLSNAQARLIVDAIDYKSKANFDENIRKAAAWLKGKVRGRRYVLITHAADDPNSPGTPFRSVHWLMRQAIQGIGKWPEAIVPAAESGEKYVDLIINKKVRVFVVLDDAVYSGSDMFGEFTSDIIDTLWGLSMEHKLPRGMSVYATAGYFSGTRKARENLARLKDLYNHIDKNIVFEFFAPGKMRTVEDFMASLPAGNKIVISTYLSRYKMHEPLETNTTRTMTMMAHKVPNGWSFPGRLGGLLEPLVTPPYKRFSLADIPTSMRVVDTRRQGRNITLTYANGTRKTYENQAGKLVEKRNNNGERRRSKRKAP